MSYKHRPSNTGIPCIVLLAGWIFLTSIITLWTQSNINQFLIIAEKTSECPYWLAFIPSFFFMPVTFVLNIISEIVQLFM
jgi:hypothetical protein